MPWEDAATAISDPARRDEVRAATDEAVALGVTGVPTVAVSGQLFWGDDRLEDVAAVLAASG
ncbi:DsbA family protein [Svornostia abyssi]|uniref:DsbA family protein n=1 Tax=Svornostia abyssi TaxID=2898438 RepID=A0ABY5PPF3_9ACTN|nr:DsbA family protein [Parviterribacteraceae bacterium J379]